MEEKWKSFTPLFFFHFPPFLLHFYSTFTPLLLHFYSTFAPLFPPAWMGPKSQFLLKNDCGSQNDSKTDVKIDWLKNLVLRQFFYLLLGRSESHDTNIKA